MSDRKSGILLHISSLPSEYGIGDLGPGARHFADFLQESKQRIWQILPVNPTDAISKHSPYSSMSAFAGNILFISPEVLRDEGLLTDAEINEKPEFLTESVQFDIVSDYKNHMLNRAYDRYLKDANIHEKHEKDFKEFVSRNTKWLDDYALYTSIKDGFNGKGWLDWPEELRNRDRDALTKFSGAHQGQIDKIKFDQYLFYKQWSRLKDYCNERNVQLMGDLSIYMNMDSVDVWCNPQNYKLDGAMRPTVVAGVPPDYFSETGQRWGNPVYDWENLRNNGFDWWVERFRFNFKLFDIIRIDHFRGLVQCWEIPADEETAVNGKWADVPADELFHKLEDVFSKPLPIVAEDLGYITDDVRDVMRRFGFPGMKILLFAFNGDMKTHPYLPHNFKDRCVVYTGTHDNNTTLGWFKNEASDSEVENIRLYLNKVISEKSITWDLIQLAFESGAEIAITPVQDILNLGDEARMNMPGTSNSNNWRWRLSKNATNQEICRKLSDITTMTSRA